MNERDVLAKIYSQLGYRRAFRFDYAQYFADVVHHVSHGRTLVYVPSLLKVTETNNVSKAITIVAKAIRKPIEYLPLNNNWLELSIEADPA